jgi:hypothetical protein
MRGLVIGFVKFPGLVGVERGEEAVLLVGDVFVEGLARYAGLCGDVGDAGLGVALAAGEERHGREKPFAMARFGWIGRHGVRPSLGGWTPRFGWLVRISGHFGVIGSIWDWAKGDHYRTRSYRTWTDVFEETRRAGVADWGIITFEALNKQRTMASGRLVVDGGGKA